MFGPGFHVLFLPSEPIILKYELLEKACQYTVCLSRGEGNLLGPPLKPIKFIEIFRYFRKGAKRQTKAGRPVPPWGFAGDYPVSAAIRTNRFIQRSIAAGALAFLPHYCYFLSGAGQTRQCSVVFKLKPPANDSDDKEKEARLCRSYLNLLQLEISS